MATSSLGAVLLAAPAVRGGTPANSQESVVEDLGALLLERHGVVDFELRTLELPDDIPDLFATDLSSTFGQNGVVQEVAAPDERNDRGMGRDPGSPTDLPTHLERRRGAPAVPFGRVIRS